MDIKEIAQKLVPGYWKRDQWNIEYFDSVGFAEALISAYKAELLKEAGEPVSYLHKEFSWKNRQSECVVKITLKAQPEYGFTTPLFPSDQVAAAIIKATGPLEHELRELRMSTRMRGEDIDELRAQLAATQEQQQTTFLQLSHALRIAEEKLAKAEQRVAEWQPISTAPKDGTRVLLCIDHGEWGDKVWTGLWGDGWMVSYGKARTEPTHWMPLPKAPANGASS